MSDTVKFFGVTNDSTPRTDLKSKLSAKGLKAKSKFFKGFQGHMEPQKAMASLLYTSFILINFNYCILIWMFCGKTAKAESSRNHKRALRVSLNGYDFGFEDVLLSLLSLSRLTGT